jgi:hypothetical protein
MFALRSFPNHAKSIGRLGKFRNFFFHVAQKNSEVEEILCCLIISGRLYLFERNSFLLRTLGTLMLKTQVLGFRVSRMLEKFRAILEF